MTSAAAPREKVVVGVDVGGTFTDIVASEGGRFRFEKVLTTPEDMRHGIQSGLAGASVDLLAVSHLFHGTTVVINALIEDRLGVVGLITTDGFRDVCEIGRGSRAEPYDMLFKPVRPLVPVELRAEVRERILGDGSVLIPLDEVDALRNICRLLAAGVECIAVSLLNSYANPDHEEQLGRLIAAEAPDLPVSLGSRLAREWKEFERTSTAILDAGVKPMMRSYIGGLDRALAKQGFRGELRILQSSGGSISPDVARERPLSLVESGPSAGVYGAAEIAKQCGFPTVLAFDVGGTTAKASLVRGGVPSTVRPYYIAGNESRPSLLPVVDIVEVGAGGGSIAYVDAGLLKVGPESAGADPGPACYGRGGVRPTVTDAQVLLGRIDPEGFLGGTMPLDMATARAAIREWVAEPLGMSVEDAARGILRVANTRMAMMLRQVSIARGVDPRELTLVATGGAGPLHAAEIARELAIREVAIPPHPAHFSALGMILSDVRYTQSRTVAHRLDEVEPRTLAAICTEIRTELADVYAVDTPMEYTYVAELGYDGQTSFVDVELTEHEAATGELVMALEKFEHEHVRRYGYLVEGEPVRLATLVVHAVQLLPKPSLSSLAGERRGAVPGTTREVVIGDAFHMAAVHHRDSLKRGKAYFGPALVAEDASTTVVGAGDSFHVDALNLLRVRVGYGH